MSSVHDSLSRCTTNGVETLAEPTVVTEVIVEDTSIDKVSGFGDYGSDSDEDSSDSWYKHKETISSWFIDSQQNTRMNEGNNLLI